MLKRIRIASFLSLALMAGCAANTGSSSYDLDNGDAVESPTERCTRVFGDFAGEATPPPIGIPVGDHELSAPEVITLAQENPQDDRAALLAEYATTLINVDAGAELDEYEVDLLVSAEQLLIRTDGRSDFDAELAADLVGTVSLLGELNDALRVEVPCMQNQDQRLDSTPLIPQRPDVTGPRSRHPKGLFIGTASPESPTKPVPLPTRTAE
jgi:hypothetical protein